MQFFNRRYKYGSASSRQERCSTSKNDGRGRKGKGEEEGSLQPSMGRLVTLLLLSQRVQQGLQKSIRRVGEHAEQGQARLRCRRRTGSSKDSKLNLVRES